MALAHGVCAALEESSGGARGVGREVRSAAVSVASLIGEALLESSGEDARGRLAEARRRLAEVRARLEDVADGASLPDAERSALLAEAAGLDEDLAAAIEAFPV